MQVDFMSSETRPDSINAAEADFDNASKKGWEFFTKFLLTNVIVTAAALIFIGFLTVWR
jgi:hypothetical protein